MSCVTRIWLFLDKTALKVADSDYNAFTTYSVDGENEPFLSIFQRHRAELK